MPGLRPDPSDIGIIGRRISLSARAGLLLPLAAYLMIRHASGSATGALAITEATQPPGCSSSGSPRSPSGRPLLLVLAGHLAKLNPESRPEIQARLADPHRRRVALALTVPTGRFIADSTAARIVVLGTGLIITTWYFRHQRDQRERRRQPSDSFERDE